MAATALTVHTRSLVLEGRPFGATGAYEKIAGTLRFAVDPAHRLHAAITDLDRAPRGADGRVEFQGDFYLLRPADPARSVVAGAAELGVPAHPAVQVVHGSTIATNALLERRGARTALITTQGFADVLEIGRQNRPELYALVPHRPPPLVPRE